MDVAVGNAGLGEGCDVAVGAGLSVDVGAGLGVGVRVIATAGLGVGVRPIPICGLAQAARRSTKSAVTENRAPTRPAMRRSRISDRVFKALPRLSDAPPGSRV
jgi:hypothetical protein